MTLTEALLQAERQAFLRGEDKRDIFVELTSYGVGRIDRDWDEGDENV